MGKAKKMNARAYLKIALLIQLFLLAPISVFAADANTFFIEDFETVFVDGAPTGWTKSYKTSTVDWTRSEGSIWLLGDNAHGGLFNAMLYAGNSDSHETYLITPVINFPDDVNEAVLEFWHKQANWGSNQDTLKVYYKTAEEGLWTPLATFTSDNEDWKKRQISLPNLTSTYYIGFLGNARFGYGVCIDDVNVYEGNAVTVPTGDNVTEYYAVIAGISDYREVDDLSYCDDDARDLRDALLALGNWKIANITVLINNQATKEGIRSAIQSMAGKADNDDVCLFFFSGHGDNGDDVAPLDESDDLDEYLVTYDSLLDSYANDISDDEFGLWIAALPTNKYVVLIDSCYSGGQFKALAAAKTIRTVKGLGYRASRKGDGFASDLTSAVTTKDLGSVDRGIVISASDDDELSEESSQLQNGVFTYYLVEGLNGPADDDGDGGISAEECYAYTRPLAAAYNPDQHAQMSDNFPGELYLTTSFPYISKCTVKAGSVELTDSISASGELASAASDFVTDTTIAVEVNSMDMAEPLLFTFPVDVNTFKNGKFSYSKTIDGVKKSFKYNTMTHRFSFSASKIDLTGLACPVNVSIEIGDYNTTLRAEESVVNGKKPIPIQLLMDVKNSLRIDKITVKRGSTTDTLTVKGGFSVANVVEANMVEGDFVVTLAGQTWDIPIDSFVAGKDKYVCKKVPMTQGGTADADFNFKTGAFKLSLKNTKVLAVPGPDTIEIDFPYYGETADIVVP